MSTTNKSNNAIKNEQANKIIQDQSESGTITVRTVINQCVVYEQVIPAHNNSDPHHMNTVQFELETGAKKEKVREINQVVASKKEKSIIPKSTEGAKYGGWVQANGGRRGTNSVVNQWCAHRGNVNKQSGFIAFEDDFPILQRKALKLPSADEGNSGIPVIPEVAEMGVEKERVSSEEDPDYCDGFNADRAVIELWNKTYAKVAGTCEKGKSVTFQKAYATVERAKELICAEKEQNVSNVFDLRKSVGPWITVVDSKQKRGEGAVRRKVESIEKPRYERVLYSHKATMKKYNTTESWQTRKSVTRFTENKRTDKSVTKKEATSINVHYAPMRSVQVARRENPSNKFVKVKSGKSAVKSDASFVVPLRNRYQFREQKERSTPVVQIASKSPSQNKKVVVKEEKSRNEENPKRTGARVFHLNDDAESRKANWQYRMLCGGGSVETCSLNFMEKVVSKCASSQVKTRIMNPLSFKSNGNQKCCMLVDGQYSLLLIPILEDGQPRAIVFCDRRKEGRPQVTTIIPASTVDRVCFFGRKDDNIMQKLLDSHGWKSCQFKRIQKKESGDPEQYLLSVIEKVLGGESITAALSIVDQEPSVTHNCSRAVLSEDMSHLKCALSRESCICGGNPVGEAVVSERTAPRRAEGKTVPCRARAKTVSKSPSPSRYNGIPTKLTKGVVETDKSGREKYFRIHSLTSLNEGELVEGYVIDAYLRILKMITRAPYRCLDPSLVEFDSGEHRVQGYPLTGMGLHPINTGSTHWCLGLFNFKLRKVQVIDSRRGVASPSEDTVNRIQKVWKLCTDVELENKNIVSREKKRQCYQDDSYNCGVFVCFHALRLMTAKNIEPKLFRSVEADQFRPVIADFLRRNLFVESEDGKLFESSVHMFPSDSLIMGGISSEYRITVTKQPLPEAPIQVIPSDGISDANGTISDKSVSTKKSSMTSKRHAEVENNSSPQAAAISNVVLPSPKSTIEKLTHQLTKTTIVNDGESPVKQRRLEEETPICTKRQLVSKEKTIEIPNLVELRSDELSTQAVEHNISEQVCMPSHHQSEDSLCLKRPASPNVNATPTKELMESTPSVTGKAPDTIDKMALQLQDTLLTNEGPSPRKQMKVVEQPVAPRRSSRRLFPSNSATTQPLQSASHDLPAGSSTHATDLGRQLCDQKNIDSLLLLICSHSNAKTVIMDEYAMQFGGISRTCCVLNRNDYQICVMLLKERRKAKALLICDKRQDQALVTLFAPNMPNSTSIDESLVIKLIGMHGWHDYNANIYQRDNVQDVKLYFCNILLAVLVKNQYEEGYMGSSKIAVFLQNNQSHGTNLINGSCGLSGAPCRCSCEKRKDAIDTSTDSSAVPVFVPVACVPHVSSQDDILPVVWGKRTHMFNDSGDKKELYLESLKCLRKDGDTLSKWLIDYVVYAFCSIVSLSELGRNLIVDPQILTNAQLVYGYKVPGYPFHIGIRYFPLCHDAHWVLAIFDFESETITVFDSFQHSQTALKRSTEDKIMEVWEIFTDSVPVINIPPLNMIAKQSGGYNCGVYVCYNVVRSIRRLNDNPLEFTETAADDYRDEMKSLLRANFHVRDEDATVRHLTHVEGLNLAPSPLQSLITIAQDVPQPRNISDVTTQQPSEKPPKSTPAKNVTATKMFERRNPYDNCASDTDDDIMRSSDEEEPNLHPQSRPELVTKCSKLLSHLANICANVTVKTVILSRHMIFHPERIQKCCVLDGVKKQYDALVFPVIKRGTLCAVAIVTKPEVKKRLKKNPNNKAIVLVGKQSKDFNGTLDERNMLVKIFRNHGWGQVSIEVKTISSENVEQLLIATYNLLSKQPLSENLTDEEASQMLNGLTKYTTDSEGLLQNGQCDEVTGLCGCPLSEDLALMCSYLKHIQTAVQKQVNVAVLSPRLLNAPADTIYKCAVWSNTLNNYKSIIMPLEYNGMYGMAVINLGYGNNKHRKQSIIYLAAGNKKQASENVSQELRKKIKSILISHRLPAMQIKLEVELTRTPIPHLCFRALSAIQTHTTTLKEFVEQWDSEVKNFKSLKCCAHVVRCPCKLYGESKARKECAFYKKGDLLPNGWTLGEMSKRCPYCDAHLFAKESSAICCMNGKVKVTEEELSQRIPIIMEKYKDMVMTDSELFSKTMQMNNNISLGSNIYRKRDLKSPGDRPLIIKGTYTAGVCHLVNRNPQEPAFAQLYLTDVDTLNASLLKYSWHTKKTQKYSADIIQDVKQGNVLVQTYETGYEIYNKEKERRKQLGIQDEPRLLMVIKDRREDIPDGVLPVNVHKGRINRPAASNQVATIWVGDLPSSEEIANGIRIHERRGATVAPHFLANLDGLLFVMLFPNGEQGYIHDSTMYRRPEGHVKTKHMKKVVDVDDTVDDEDDDNNLDGEDDMVVQNQETSAKFVSRREFTLYMLARRGLADDLKYHRILGWGKLTHQWILFSWIRVEADRITHISKNLTEIRGIKQSALFTHLDQELQRRNIPLGALCGLPASYPTGPKWQQKLYKNAMQVALRLGNPTLLVTVTGNPDWAEIVANRIHGKDDDPMLIARVFFQKLQEVLDDIVKKKIFGEVIALQYSIEFQKRGMPHAHILITLKERLTPARVDQIVSAEMPRMVPKTDPTYDSVMQLRAKIIKHMIHRPCRGKKHMACRQGVVDRAKCIKKYPYDYSEYTYVSKSGHTIYMRRQGEPFIVGNQRNFCMANNCDIVPHNKFLLSKFDCHINVEIVSSARACKYIFKYIYKGPDHLVLELMGDTQESIDARNQRTIRGANNEPMIELNLAKEHVNTRYLGHIEAAYRLLGYPLQGTLHTVIRLSAHMPGDKYICFRANQPVPDEPKKSQLEAYFDVIASARAKGSPEKTLLWTEVAEQYTFNEKTREYKKRLVRQRNLAYVNFVPPKFTENYALRLLLNKKAADGFEDLRTINGIVHTTFTAAAVAAGYIHEDEEWDRCLALLAHNAMPREIRRVFASLLVYCSVVNGKDLWEKYRADMRERRPNWSNDRLDQFSLSHIQWVLNMQGSSLTQCNMDGLLNPVVADPTVQYDPDRDGDQGNNQAPNNNATQLNDKQTTAVNAILNAIQQPMGAQKRMFFLYGKAGCGKTYTYNHIIREGRRLGKRVIAVASTGIAATLLEGGRTAHSSFKIPIQLTEDSIISMDARSPFAERLRKADLIAWDEAPMQSRFAMEAVDRMLRDICEPHRRNLPFGGATIVFGGDWSQFLPVVRSNRGSDLEADTIKVTLKSSPLWAEIQVLTLDRNMRVVAGEEQHMKWLRDVGEGKCQYLNTPNINLPAEMYVETEEEVINWLYPPEVMCSPERLGRVALLAVKNDDTLDLNEKILQRVPGREFVLKSADECADKENGLFGLTESVEYLNTQTPPGMPQHKLTLRVGCIIMLLRNIDLSSNLCNGTRLEVVDVLEAGNTHLLRCRHLNGDRNSDCFISRMPLPYDDGEGYSGLSFTRVQFPVRLSFAMTTNKSQGQTFDKVGLILRSPAFAHGSTYVALSRCTSKKGIKVTLNRKIPADNGRLTIPVRNIVYRSMIDEE